jgi:hypothetical protein
MILSSTSCAGGDLLQMVNYLRGGWHPLGYIGVGEAPKEAALTNMDFDSPAFDDSLHYEVPEELLSVKPPPLPQVKR